MLRLCSTTLHPDYLHDWLNELGKSRSNEPVRVWVLEAKLWIVDIIASC